MTPMSESGAPGMEPALETQIAALLEQLGGRTSLAAQRLASSAHVLRVSVGDEYRGMAPSMGLASLAIRSDAELPAASLAKLPIAVELLRRADLAQLDLRERCDTSGEPRAGGGGALDYLDPSVRLTVADLCFLMLALSDNTAANYLLRLVGIGEVNHTVERLGLRHTRLARRFMDMAARAAGRENVTSAADMVSLLALLRGGALPGAGRLREMLATQQRADDLAAWLPAEALFAHKTGSLDDAFHDAGILTGPGGVCVFCVMTVEQADVAAARIAVGRILRMLWRAWCASDTSDTSDTGNT